MQYVSQSNQLGNPNVYLVLAVYARQTNGTGFLQSTFGDNSVQSAETWLKQWRNLTFGR
jgi:hypothetical protein